MITRILIVDDNSASLYMMESLLKAYGIEVTSAENGKDALDKARLNPPDLIVSDILMPVMDGYTLCRACKSDEQLKHIPFVFYTATYTEPKDEAFALSLGAERFIIKPQEPDIFINIIKELLEEEYTVKNLESKPLGEEMEFFRQHNEVLFKKLEKKMVDLEIANKDFKILEERYRLIFENATDVIYMIDANLNILGVSPSVERILGYKPEDFIGRPVTDLKDILAPESFEQAVADTVLILKGETITATIYRFIAKDGTIRYGEVSGSPIMRDGKIIGIISIARDITKRKLAEDALRESEEKYRELVKYAPAGIYEVDYETGRFKSVNDVICEYTGYTKDELLNTNLYNLLTEESQKLMGERFEKLSAGEKMPQTVEYCIRTKGGEKIWALLNARYIYKEGKLKGATGVIYNINERKQVEEKLRESEEKYRTIIENMEEGYHEVDLKGNFTFFNDSICKILGYEREDLLGMNNSQYADEENTRKVYKIYNRVYRTGEPVKNFEWQIIRKDGVHRDIEVSISLIRNTEGNPTGFRGIVKDVTDRKRAEEALKKQLDLFERITETSPVGITLVDIDGSIRFANLSAEKILGLTKSEITRRVYNDPRWHIIDESGEPFPEDKLPFSIVMNTGAAVYNVRHGIEWPDGRRVILSINAAPLKDDSNKVIGMVAALQDITERKRMEEELLKADKLESVGILAGGIAHDFNNILTSISGNISMAKMQVKPGHKIFDLLSAAETASVRAQGLTRQLLTFAKGGMPLKETALIQKLIKESSLFVLRGSKSECEFQIAEDLWPVEADVGQISQVISNIVINANQAMPEGGIIRIEAENLMPEKIHEIPVKPGRYIHISIKDQGVGIAEKHLSKIFDPYFTTKQAGSGLGLATAYSIIKKHNGHISVDSLPGDRDHVSYLSAGFRQRDSGKRRSSSVNRLWQDTHDG